VLPGWLASTLGVTRLTITEHSTRADIPWGSKVSFGRAVKTVCEACNSGWMSDLETTVRPFLGPLALGHRTSLAATDQGALATWLWKTMLMFDCSKPTRSYDRDAYGRFYVDRRPPPLNLQMWLGGFRLDEHAARMGFRIDELRIDGIRAGAIHVFTLAVGSVLLQSLFAKCGRSFRLNSRLRGGSPLDDAVTRFWPTAAQAVAPPPVAVGDEDFETFTCRWARAEHVLEIVQRT
jgi:hypothetical protein